MKRYTPNTILITGASQGIGAACALVYAAKGIHLILIARNEDKLAKIKEQCLAKGAMVTTLSMDVRDKKNLEQFIQEFDDKQPIDLVIANAGVSNSSKLKDVSDDEQEADSIWQINLFGVLNTINPLIERMVNRRCGQIALIGSIAGLRGLPQSPVYCASKAAVHNYGQGLGARLRPYNVQVSVICPGFVKTAMSDKLKSPKPFLLSADKAAHIIKTNLAKNKAFIIFPKSLYYLTKLANCLPNAIIDAILNRYRT
ncbi:MAG: SDR family NAD(P)-dependent oxidoreductase [Proteobacteria bacterium]|nr:SDR family NAD(P)-dependent oxidoreductase [Pseudomonadota bacterium]